MRKLFNSIFILECSYDTYSIHPCCHLWRLIYLVCIMTCPNNEKIMQQRLQGHFPIMIYLKVLFQLNNTNLLKTSIWECSIWSVNKYGYWPKTDNYAWCSDNKYIFNLRLLSITYSWYKFVSLYMLRHPWLLGTTLLWDWIDVTYILSTSYCKFTFAAFFWWAGNDIFHYVTIWWVKIIIWHHV
jgi:hypothetical protein